MHTSTPDITVMELAVVTDMNATADRLDLSTAPWIIIILGCRCSGSVHYDCDAERDLSSDD